MKTKYVLLVLGLLLIAGALLMIWSEWAEEPAAVSKDGSVAAQREDGAQSQDARGAGTGGVEVDPAVVEKLRAMLIEERAGGAAPAAQASEEVKEFKRLVDARDRRERRQAADFLAKYIRETPGAAQAVADLIKSGELTVDYTMYAFKALTKAGNKEAQFALTGILSDASTDKVTRVQSAIALTQVEQPTADIVEPLLAQIKAGEWSASPAENISGSAAVTLGMMGAKLRSSDPEVAMQIQGELLSKLNDTTDPQQAGPLLGALGATRDTTMIEKIEPYLDSDSAAMRSTAVQSLALMNDDKAEQKIVSRFANEASADVRRRIVESLQTRKDRSAESIAILSEDLYAEPDPDIRATIIRLVGDYAQKDPRVRDALQAAMRQESNSTNRRLIERYIAQ